jgi:hypothetical protein
MAGQPEVFWWNNTLAMCWLSRPGLPPRGQIMLWRYPDTIQIEAFAYVLRAMPSSSSIW